MATSFNTQNNSFGNQGNPQQQAGPPQPPQAPQQQAPSVPQQGTPPQGQPQVPRQTAQGYNSTIQLSNGQSANYQHPYYQQGQNYSPPQPPTVRPPGYKEKVPHASGKEEIRWQPPRSKSQVEVELTDSVIVGLPETLSDEHDPMARVVLAWLAEILALREQVVGGVSPAGIDPNVEARLGILERILVDQQQSLSAGARAMTDAAHLQAAKEKAMAEAQQNASQVISNATPPSE